MSLTHGPTFDIERYRTRLLRSFLVMPPPRPYGPCSPPGDLRRRRDPGAIVCLTDAVTLRASAHLLSLPPTPPRV